MHKDQQEELRRLEEALLSPEEVEEEIWSTEEETTDEWLDEFYEAPAQDYAVYNTDDADVDLDAYSEDVHRGSHRSGCLIPLIFLLLAVLGVLIGWLLLKLEVIPWLS